MNGFYCYVFAENGPAVAGCSVRVLNGSGDDVTPLLTGGLSPFVTDDSGSFSFIFPFRAGAPTPLPAGVYTFSATAPGYEPYLANPWTGSDPFTGIGLVSISLTPLPIGTDTTVTRDESPYVCPMYPVEVIVDAQAPSAKWEQIEATITAESGKSSQMLVPITAGQARINLQARLALDTTLIMVPDDVPAVIDPLFAQKFTTTFASVNPSGSFPINGEVIVYAANAFPSLDQNDLSNYTNDNDTGLAEWLTPWSVLPKFQGRYADAMIWLPITGPGQYSLVRTNMNINRQVLSVTTVNLESILFANKNVVRVRIQEPVEGAYYAELVIKLGAVVKTKPLTVRYIYG